MPFDGSIRRPRLRHSLLLLLHWLMRVEVTGLEHLPPPPYVLAGNHLSVLDGPLIALLAPDPTVLLVAARFVRRRWIRPFLETSAGVIALGRGEEADQAVAEAIQALRRGIPLVIAPEGGVSRTGVLRKGRPGVARVARDAEVPVVPLGWWGQEKCWRDWRRLRRPLVHLAFGGPVDLDPAIPAEEAAARVMEAIEALLPEAYRAAKYRRRSLR